jgi:hypothetical protein
MNLRENMVEDFLYDEKFWITILIVLVIISFTMPIAIIAVVVWIILILWNKYKLGLIPPLKKIK